MFKRSLIALSLFVTAACSAGGGYSNTGGGDGGTSGSTGAARCVYKEPGTNFAPCVKDSDCFGSYCDMTGKPGPYCHVPGAKQVDALHGITCSKDAQCEDILPSDAVAQGIVGKCQGRSNLDPAVCQFHCDTTSTAGPAPTTSSGLPQRFSASAEP